MRGSLERVEDWVGLAQQAQFRSHNLATICNVSLRQLENFFAEVFHRPPQYWLDEVRLCAAKKLLTERGTVKEVAVALSFCNSSHFIREFKRYYGCTPLNYRSIESDRVARKRAFGPESSGVPTNGISTHLLAPADHQALISDYRAWRSRRTKELVEA